MTPYFHMPREYFLLLYSFSWVSVLPSSKKKSLKFPVPLVPGDGDINLTTFFIINISAGMETKGPVRMSTRLPPIS